MAYELSGSIASGNITPVFVEARSDTLTRGGSISPDGNTIAVTSHRHGGATNTDIGIDFWKSGSSGWVEVDSVDVSLGAGHAAKSIHWLSNEEILALNSFALESYKSGSNGWALNYSTDISNNSFFAGHMWISPGKTVVGITEDINWFSTSYMEGDAEIKFVHSGSNGFDDIKVVQLSDGIVTAMAWPDEENILVGQPYHNSLDGRVVHLRSGSSGYTTERTTVGHSGHNGTKKFGIFLYWHSASNSGIYGGTNANVGNTAVLNLIPSGSTGYLPVDNPHNAAGLTVIDTSMLAQHSDGTQPWRIGGNTINVDSSTPDRIFATSAPESNASGVRGRVHLSIESGSEGWKVNQLNPPIDGFSQSGVGQMNDNSSNPSQLASGASRIVTFKTGSATITPNVGFTVWETGLPNGGTSQQSGGSFDQVPEITINPSTVSITESGTAVTVTANLNFVADPGESIEVTTIASNLDNTEFIITPATHSYDGDSNELNKTFTITPVEDFFSDGDQGPFEVTFITQNHPTPTNKNGLTGSVNITVVDSQTLSDFTVSPNSGVIIHENSSQQFQVSLPREPTGDVAIEYGLNNLTRASIDNSSDGFNNNKTLIFNPSNWNTAQVVTVNADDDDLGGQSDEQGSITFILSGAQTTAIEYTESNNSSSLDKLINITIQNDDTPAVNVSPAPD